MLGEAFHKQFKDDYTLKCTDKDVNTSWLSFMDFRDFCSKNLTPMKIGFTPLLVELRKQLFIGLNKLLFKSSKFHDFDDAKMSFLRILVFVKILKYLKNSILYWIFKAVMTHQIYDFVTQYSKIHHFLKCGFYGQIGKIPVFHCKLSNFNKLLLCFTYFRVF